MRRFRSESGAVAVEFALAVPVLLLLLIGMVEFGRVYNAQLQVTSAAREGVRIMAIHNDLNRSIDATLAAAPTLALATTDIKVGKCTGEATNAVVTVSYPVELVSGLFDGITVTGRGVMRCGG